MRPNKNAHGKAQMHVIKEKIIRFQYKCNVIELETL